MERSRCCSSWGTCGLVRGAKEGKKEERRDTGDIIIVQDPDTIQLMEHVRGGRKLDWNALSFENIWGGGSLNASRNQRILKVEIGRIWLNLLSTE